jgi:hypothetical protein
MILAYRYKKPFEKGGKGSDPETKPSVPKPPKFVLGDELEYRVARLHIFMGYFVRRACPIYTVANLDQATDLDVLALRYAQPFRREILISECKSGVTGPLDRIFWLAGVKGFVNAREAFLVRKSTKWNIKDFAKNTGVQIIDLHKVEELETNFKVGAGEWPGVSDKGFYSNKVREWNESLESSPAFWELYQTLISEIRYDEPFAGLNYLLFQLRRLTKQFEKMSQSVFHRYLLAECLAQLSVFLMRIAESVFDLSAKDRDAFILRGLTYGSLDPKFAERILNNAFTITRQAVMHVTNKAADIDPSFFQMPVPPGAEQTRIIVNEIIGNYPISLTFPQITDLVLNEVLVKQNRTGGWLKRVFAYGDLPARLDLTRLYMSHLVEMEACPKSLLQQLNTVPENATKQDPVIGPATIKSDPLSAATKRQRAAQGKAVSDPDQKQENAWPQSDPWDFELKPPPEK